MGGLGVNGIVGVDTAELLEHLNGQCGTTYTIDVGILDVADRILRIEHCGLLVPSGGSTTIILVHLDVAKEDIAAGLVLAHLDGLLGILGGVGSILHIQESSTQTSNGVGILLVHLEIFLHLRSNSLGVVLVLNYQFAYGVELSLELLRQCLCRDSHQEYTCQYVFKHFHI